MREGRQGTEGHYAKMQRTWRSMPYKKIKEVEIDRAGLLGHVKIHPSDGRPPKGMEQGREVVRFSFVSDQPSFSVVSQRKGH